MARTSNEELRTWDGASIVVALYEQRVYPRYRSSGLAGLNQAERVLLSIFELDNEICNGGFGQWLFHVAGDLLAITPACLREIGAGDLAVLVGRILVEFGEHQAFREADLAFYGLEQDMLSRLYEFSRTHLADFRSD